MKTTVFLKTKLRLSLTRFVGLFAFAATCINYEALAQSAQNSQTSPENTIQVTVTAKISEELNALGATTFSRADIQNMSFGDGDLNNVARTLPNVQFDPSAKGLTPQDILDLRPSELSISGGRPYENNFVLGGLAINSLMDSSNTNRNLYNDLVTSPQTLFINPTLVTSLTVYDSNVPVEFGDFTGGVVEANLRDPKKRLGLDAGFTYTSDAMTHFTKSDNAVISESTMRNQPEFSKMTYDLVLDMPVAGNFSSYFGWTRTISSLKNNQVQGQYGGVDVKADSTSANYIFKGIYEFQPATILKFTTVYTPYESEFRDYGDKYIHENGWLNTLEFAHSTGKHSVEASLGYNQSRKNRESPLNGYVYKKFPDGNPLWGTSDSQAATGGDGDLELNQDDLSAKIKYSLEITKSLKFQAGANYIYTTAEATRPETSYAYRQASSATAVLDPLATSAHGPDDKTVIEGEQGLNHRIDSLAFDARVNMQRIGGWAQFQGDGHFGRIGWGWRAGVRYDYDDFLKNNNLAPRVVVMIKPLPMLALSVGAARYYDRMTVSYKLREKYPDSYVYRRTYVEENGKHVYYDTEDSWYLYQYSKSSSFGQADVKTPYKDEISSSISLSNKTFGVFKITGILAKYKDKFSSSPAENISYEYYYNGVWRSLTYRSYHITNEGWKDYKSLALEWTRSWRNHALRANATLSKSKQSISQNLFEENPEKDIVYYNGQFLSRYQISSVQQNFANPFIMNIAWTSEWFSKRLIICATGKWTGSYNGIEGTNSTRSLDGIAYPVYADFSRDSQVDVNLHITWNIFRGRNGILSLEAYGYNLLDDVPYSGTTVSANYYQQGRSARVGMRYVF